MTNDCEYFVPDVALQGVKEWEYDKIKARADIRIENILPYVKDKIVLDIGCGSGYATNEYSKVAKSIIGLDIDETAIKFAREHYPHIIFDKGTVLHPFIGKYDIIIASEMMEHLPNEDWDTVLANVKNALNDGGIFIGTIPVEGKTEGWSSHKARYDRNVFTTKFKKYFMDGMITILQFPWYTPSYFFRFIKEGE